LGTDAVRKREEIDSQYKATRERKNDELKVQFQDIKRILELIGINNVGIKGFEGDDIVGTYIKKSSATKNFIVTGDKDAFQLVSDNTYIVYPLNGFKEIQLITPDYVKEKYEIPVEQFVELKAIMGDDGDNIKGIQGCGEKTAVKLLHHYGCLNEVVKNANCIDCKGVNVVVKKNIIEWSKRIDDVKKLVTIRQDVEVPYNFDECEIHLDWESARDIFRKLEFNSFIKKLNGGEFYGS
jgi:DNA polymerase-1